MKEKIFKKLIKNYSWISVQAQTSLCKYVQVSVSLHAQVFTRKFKVISNKFAYTHTQKHTHTGTHTHTVIDVCRCVC